MSINELENEAQSRDLPARAHRRTTTKLSVAGVPAEVRTVHLPKMCQRVTALANLIDAFRLETSVNFYQTTWRCILEVSTRLNVKRW
jgi:hypothetical protein